METKPTDLPTDRLPALIDLLPLRYIEKKRKIIESKNLIFGCAIDIFDNLKIAIQIVNIEKEKLILKR